MDQIPDSPEGVALALLQIIITLGGLVGGVGNLSISSQVRDEYRKCLWAVRGYPTGESDQDQIWRH